MTVEERLALLETKVAALLAPVAAAENMEWREHVIEFHPSIHNELPWEETLVSLGVLFGAQQNLESDQIKKALARIVSICEYVEERRMAPGPIKDVQKNAKALYIHFQPEGSDEEAVYSAWCYGELGDLAASWLRSLYA